MKTEFRFALVLLLGIALLLVAAALYWIAATNPVVASVLAVLGAALTLGGGYALRAQLPDLLRGRRGEIALFTLGTIGVLIAVGYLSTHFAQRWDLSQFKEHSLSPQTIEMMKRVDRPVQITFFHDPMMRETVDLYEQIAAANSRIKLELFDPMLNPAQARLLGVQFAGTALLKSEGREVKVDKQTEAEIANAVLRVSRGSTQTVCFLEGHNEADPFSKESHDHLEGTAGHSHGLGQKFVVHEQHGMAKARDALEAMNYHVEKISLLKGGATLDACALLIVAGPKIALLPPEISAIRAYLDKGRNAFFMIDPHVETGLEPLLRDFGVVLDNNMIIDDASHFLTDPSAPAVTVYNDHKITRQLPLTFFPGARSLSPLEERPPGVSAWPLANSSKSSYGESTPERAQFDQGKDLAGPLTIMVMITRRPETANNAKAIAAQLRGEAVAENEAPKAAENMKRSRLVVAGDADFATNSFFHILGNGNLFLNTVNSLAEQENMIGLEPRTFDLPRVNVTNQQIKAMFLLSVLALPVLLALIGTAVWWKQR